MKSSIEDDAKIWVSPDPKVDDRSGTGRTHEHLVTKIEIDGERARVVQRSHLVGRRGTRGSTTMTRDPRGRGRRGEREAGERAGNSPHEDLEGRMEPIVVLARWTTLMDQDGGE